MSVYDSPDLLLNDPSKVIDILVHALRGGYLSLFLGAGISISTERPGVKLFPSWSSLVKDCCSTVGHKFDDSKVTDNTYLRRTAEGVEDICVKTGKDFLNIVESALYTNCSVYDKTTMKLDLLVSLGSLIMSSVRGSAAAVINYNFDDLLEWYLELHGFQVHIVSSVPTLIPTADAIIYHPHGFLPLTSRFKKLRSESLIFGERSYQRALDDHAWNEIQRSRFGSNVSLFIGLSGDDPHIELLFSKVHDQLQGKRILGVMLLSDTAANRDKEDHNKRRGVINYYLPTHDILPDFLLDLCRSAAGV